MNRVGLVVIARNEGERLRACIDSVASAGAAGTIVYVDSGSTDGSPEWVRARGLEVVELDMSRPFSAARARNAGFERALARTPDLEFVQFVDGDCVLAPGWLDVAVAAMRANEALVVVCGQLNERFPEASVYNRVSEIGWDGPTGEILYCGGIFVARAAAFATVGGFDPSVTAGEEPELCGRLRARGGRIERLALPMASHDAAMFTFAQWWRRQLRTGRFDMEITQRFDTEPMQHYRRQIRSARVWAVGWPLVSITAVGAAAGLLGAAAAGLVAAAAAALLPLQIARIAQRTHRAGRPWALSFTYAALMMAGKWGQIAGQVWHTLDRLTGRSATLIEYKKGAATAGIRRE